MYIIPMDIDIIAIREFVGPIKYAQLKDVDSFLSEEVALFTPSTGPCGYAITKDHYHPSYSFILSFDSFGRVAIDQKEIQSEPRCFTSFSPNVVHHEILNDESLKYIAICIKKDFFEKQWNDYIPGDPPEFRADSFESTKELRLYLKDFMIEAENKLPGFQKILEAIGLNITHSIIRILLDFDTSKQEVGSRIEINNTIEFMHLNYNKKISVNDLSDIVSLSPSHFTRIFKTETGKSPMDYLIHLRLEKAKKLLMTGEMNLTEIAMGTGFNSSSHFTTSFTKHYKITPSRFKQAI